MSESETYVTKQNPSLDDWLDFNKDYFAQLRGEVPVNAPNYAPFVDVDLYAAEEKVTTDEYFERVRKTVGSLGRAGLQLVHSEMDDAFHIIVAPIDATT